EQRWMPEPLQCLIVGENPGRCDFGVLLRAASDPKRDRVRVRRELLNGLDKVGLISEPTLEAFRDAGFLFDHAIRCPLASFAVNKERPKANRYDSERVAHPTHLVAALKRARVVMGDGTRCG